MAIGDKLLGAVEAGGTKMVCAVGRADGTLLGKMVIPTGLPEPTVDSMCQFFEGKGISALGLGTFGPVGLNPDLPDYGHVLRTVKPGWQDFDFRRAMQLRLGVPVAIDTDVNAACLGEVAYGSSNGLDVVAYVTVGTGVGVGVCVGGRPLHGMLHPEAGHIRVERADGDGYAGCCAAHGDCLEGLASGPAVCARYGVERASDLVRDPGFLELEAGYLAQGIATWMLAYSPQRIVVGGGVADHVPGLLPLVRDKVEGLIGGFLRAPELQDMDSYLAAPSCGGDQGVLGAIALAAQARAD